MTFCERIARSGDDPEPAPNGRRFGWHADPDRSGWTHTVLRSQREPLVRSTSPGSSKTLVERGGASCRWRTRTAEEVRTVCRLVDQTCALYPRFRSRCNDPRTGVRRERSGIWLVRPSRVTRSARIAALRRAPSAASTPAQDGRTGRRGAEAAAAEFPSLVRRRRETSPGERSRA
jgi:hypothetical protein